MFAGWTLFVWGTRVANDPGALPLAATFLLPAGALVVLVWRRRARAVAVVVPLLAAWTAVVWVVRGVGIALGDHGAGFVAVHLALGAVSIALAAWAYSQSRRLKTATSTPVVTAMRNSANG